MRLLPLLALAVAAPALAACTQNATPSAGGDDRTITVSSTSDACNVSATEAPAGKLTFDVTNDGSQVTEFYLLGEDGQRIVAEVENIGPSLSRELTVNAPAGTYITACKPGMKGKGIRAQFTVTGSASRPRSAPTTSSSSTQRRRTTRPTSRTSPTSCSRRPRSSSRPTSAGDDDAARALYPVARTHWERIETVAESFGDLDPKMDAREADLEPGQKWTGWHRIEKDLWPARAEHYTALTAAGAARPTPTTCSPTPGPSTAGVQKLTFTVDQIANGSRGLLEEVANGKVTGEEEYWSRTDLWDFQANVDGARVGFEGVRADPRGEGPRAGQDARRPLRRRCRTLLDAAARRRRLHDLRPAHPRARSRHSPTR